MNYKNPIGSKLADEYVKKYPQMASLALARKMYNDNKYAFTGLNAAACAVRYRRGALGGAHRAVNSNRTKLSVTPPSKFNPLNPLNLPASDEKPWVPFNFDGAKRVLVISDIHIPYHNIAALTCALRDGKKRGCDGVLINGDLSDFHQLSRFVKDPSKRDFKGERKTTVEFLTRLRDIYPKARIVFKSGNHDDRLWSFFAAKIPEVFNDEKIANALSLASLLELEKMSIEYVTEKRQIMLGHLSILHGHEFNAGFAPPVNPARGAFLKAKDCVLVGHHHKTSEHTETTLGRKIITTWSTGCLCELRPAYDPYNAWNHGHAIVELSGSDYHVINKRQLNGEIL